MHAVCPPVLGHSIPIYEEGALISAVTAVMQECCRKFPPTIFPEIRGGHTYLVMGKKVSNYIAGIVHIGPERRYTLSIYSTTTLFLLYNHPILFDRESFFLLLC